MKTFILSLFLLSSMGIHAQIEILNTNIEPCDDQWDVYYRWDILMSYERSGDTLFLTLGISQDCVFGGDCGYFEVKEGPNSIYLHYQEDTVKYDENGFLRERCPSSCLCFFTVEFQLLYTDHKRKDIYYEEVNLSTRKGTYKPRQSRQFEIINEDTVNVTDQYGIKRGTWLLMDENGQKISEVIYSQDKENGIIYFYEENGKKEKEYILINTIPVIINHYKNGYLTDQTKRRKEIEEIELVRNERGLLREVKVYYEDRVEIIR